MESANTHSVRPSEESAIASGDTRVGHSKTPAIVRVPAIPSAIPISPPTMLRMKASVRN